jgi:hypothetical protein
MNLKISGFSSISFLVCAIFFSHLAVFADAISPAITAGGRAYSHEEPNSSFYGTGVSGRLAEASALRFEGDQETVSGDFDSAMPKLAKAVQLDPNDPSGHILYARAMTGKINSSPEPDPAMLNLAIHEWKLIWRHDADLTEQTEGRQQTRALMKIAKKMAKEQEEKAQQSLAAKDQANPQ